MHVSLLVAYVCGLLPLAGGLVVFFAWYFTRASALEATGLVIIFVGMMLTIPGLIAARIYTVRTRGSGTLPWRTRASTPVAIMLANFPIAAGILTMVSHLMSAYVIIVHNTSSKALEQLILECARSHYPFGTVHAGVRAERTFHFDCEGSVTYRATWEGRSVSGLVDGYVSGNGGSATIDVHSDGTILVTGNVPQPRQPLTE